MYQGMVRLVVKGLRLVLQIVMFTSLSAVFADVG